MPFPLSFPRPLRDLGAAIAATVAIGFLTGAAARAELLRNGEFEELASLPRDWVGQGVRVAASGLSANGSHSLECEPAGKSGTVWQNLELSKPVDGRVRFLARVRVEGSPAVRFFVTDGKQTADLWSSGAARLLPGEWNVVNVEKQITLSGPSAKFGVSISGGGRVRIDDLSLVLDAGPNLIENGGFDGGRAPVGESWTLGNMKPGSDDQPNRNGFHAELLENGGRDGGGCVRVTVKSLHGIDIYYPTLTLSLKPGVTYRYSAWMKGRGLPLAINAQAAGNYRKMYASSCYVAGRDGDWTKMAVDFEVPPDVDKVKLNLLRFPSKTSKEGIAAEIWIDDMELREGAGGKPAVVPRERNVDVAIDDKNDVPYRGIKFGVNEGPLSLGVSDAEHGKGRFMMRYDYPPLAKALKELGIDCLRWGGTWVNWWDWKNDWMFDMNIVNIHHTDPGYISRRRRFASLSKARFGKAATWFNEYLGLCKATGISPLVCVNVNTGTPESAAELVRYLGEKGFAAPDLEMGNELRGKKYIELAGAFAQAIRKVSPHVRLGSSEDRDAMAAAMEKANWHDAWIPHKYYREAYTDVYDLSRHAFTYSEYSMKVLMRQQALHPGKPMWLTEWGWDPYAKYSREKSLLAALWCADMLMQQVEYSKVLEYSVMHSLFDIYYGLLDYDGDGRLIRSVPYFAMRMFLNAIKGGEATTPATIGNMPLIYSFQESRQRAEMPAAPNIPGLVVRSMRHQDGRRSVFVLNRTKDRLEMALRVNGKSVGGEKGDAPRILGVERLAGDKLEDLERVNGPSVNSRYADFANSRPVSERETVKPVTLPATGASVKEVPPFSFTVITLDSPKQPDENNQK